MGISSGLPFRLETGTENWVAWMHESSTYETNAPPVGQGSMGQASEPLLGQKGLSH